MKRNTLEKRKKENSSNVQELKYSINLRKINKLQVIHMKEREREREGMRKKKKVNV